MFFYWFILRFWGYCIYLDCCKIGLLRSVCAGAASIQLTTISYLLRSGRGDGVFLRLCLYLIYCNILPLRSGRAGPSFLYGQKGSKEPIKGNPFDGFPLIGSYLFVFLFLWCLPSGPTLSKRSTEYNALFLAAFAHFCPYRKEGPARPERKGEILQ